MTAGPADVPASGRRARGQVDSCQLREDLTPSLYPSMSLR
jgi:hypothetical protein